jgi:hypothetical protein
MSPLRTAPISGEHEVEQKVQLRHRIAKLRWMGLDSEADELAKRAQHDHGGADGLLLPSPCPETD